MTNAEIGLHEEYIQAAFDCVLKAEAELTEIDGKLSKSVAALRMERALAESTLYKAWKALDFLMQETGEVEVLLKADNGWNKIYYTTPRQKVVVDDAAVPDNFCKIERKPKLKEIGEELDRGALFNWARYETGESKLAWRNVKKGAI